LLRGIFSAVDGFTAINAHVTQDKNLRAQ